MHSVARRIAQKAKGLLFPPQKLYGAEYWRDRVRRFGRRSVLHLSHGDDEYDEVTRRQKEEIFPHLRKALNGNEKTALDFGCGPGRFTTGLAEIIGGRAIGVDIVPEIISIAPKEENVIYELMKEGSLPLPDDSVDVVWCCLVLGGIKGAVLEKSLKEINRVLKDNGLLFLVENTSEKKNGDNWEFRSADDYKEMLPFAPLSHLHDYEDLGERISIFAGRKRSCGERL